MIKNPTNKSRDLSKDDYVLTGTEAASALDDDFREAIEGLPEYVRDLVHYWQRDDRAYEELQRAIRDENYANDHPEAGERADIMNAVILRHQLHRPVQVYRGVRDTQKVFGVVNANLAGLVGQVIDQEGLFATTVHLDVAISEFTHPSHGGGAAVLRLILSAGQPAFWVAGAGDPSMAYQGELLLPAFVQLRIESVDCSGPVPVIVASVVP